MEAAQVLDIRTRLVDTATQVLELSRMVEQLEVYPFQASDLEDMYKRMLDIFCEIKLEQAG